MPAEPRYVPGMGGIVPEHRLILTKKTGFCGFAPLRLLPWAGCLGQRAFTTILQNNDIAEIQPDPLTFSGRGNRGTDLATGQKKTGGGTACFVSF